MTWEPTNELRFLIRIGLHAERDQPAGEQAYRVLQQRWLEFEHFVSTQSTAYSGAQTGKRYTGNSEWRDIPEVTGA